MDTGLIWFFLPLIVLVAMTIFIARPGRRLRTLICTRCEGTGQIDEHWPDPSAPGGWHDVHGKCPKCGGVGKV
jgi:hypothetical protein